MSNYNSFTTKSCMYELMAKLLKKEEQFKDEGHFCTLDNKRNRIPFLLYTNQGKLFKGKGMDERACDWLLSSFFTVNSLDGNGCATLSILEPVGMDGCRVESFPEVFSLIETNFCLTVDLNFFCAIQFLPSKLVELPLPIIEQKCK